MPCIFLFLQNVTKTRMLVYCCPGYTEIKEVLDTTTTSTTITSNGPAEMDSTTLSSTRLNETAETLVCRPICRGGCGKGICHAPNSCKCDVGFEGRYCSQSKFYILYKNTPPTHTFKTYCQEQSVTSVYLIFPIYKLMYKWYNIK